MAEKYHFYVQPAKNKVVCVAHFAGKPVRGVAVCSEKDTFDLETGKAVAQAYCDLAMAELRVKYREKERQVLEDAYQRALKKLSAADMRESEAYMMLHEAEIAAREAGCVRI